MSPVTPVMASRRYSNPPIAGAQIHSSLTGLNFTPMAANAIQDIFTRKLRPECLLNYLCLHSRNELRQLFTQLLRQVDERVQPHIEGNSQQGIYAVSVEAVWATEVLVKLVAGPGPGYSYANIMEAAGFMVYSRALKPSMQIKADAALLTAARYYYADQSTEFAESFTPAEEPSVPPWREEVQQLWRGFLML